MEDKRLGNAVVINFEDENGCLAGGIWVATMLKDLELHQMMYGFMGGILCNGEGLLAASF